MADWLPTSEQIVSIGDVATTYEELLAWSGREDVRIDFEREGDPSLSIQLARQAIEAAGVYDDMPASEAVVLMAHWLQQNCRYTHDMEDREPELALQGGAICAGYAKAYEIMCLVCGIDCRFIVGWATTGNAHCWNQVCVDGIWRYVDTTVNSENSGIYCDDSDMLPISIDLWWGYREDERGFLNRD